MTIVTGSRRSKGYTNAYSVESTLGVLARPANALPGRRSLSHEEATKADQSGDVRARQEVGRKRIVPRRPSRRTTNPGLRLHRGCLEREHQASVGPRQAEEGTTARFVRPYDCDGICHQRSYCEEREKRSHCVVRKHLPDDQRPIDGARQSWQQSELLIFAAVDPVRGRSPARVAELARRNGGAVRDMESVAVRPIAIYSSSSITPAASSSSAVAPDREYLAADA